MAQEAGKSMEIGTAQMLPPETASAVADVVFEDVAAEFVEGGVVGAALVCFGELFDEAN